MTTPEEDFEAAAQAARAEDFEKASRDALDREMSLMRQQAAKRHQEAAVYAASPERQLHKRQLAAGRVSQPDAAATARRHRLVEAIHAAIRHAVDGPETAYSRDPWEPR